MSFDVGPLGAEDVEVAVDNCGLCHSDLSIANDEWGLSEDPFILGHEVTGRIVAVGTQAERLKVGQKVGAGWNSGSCIHCEQCMVALHTGRFSRGRFGIQPIHDLLEGCGIRMDGRLTKEDVLRFLEGRGQHELRTIGADEPGSLIDDRPISRSGTQVYGDLGTVGGVARGV